jgi:hypothetical protein
MNAEQAPVDVAAFARIPIHRSRQIWRALRECGGLPGGPNVRLGPEHVARVLLALTTLQIKDTGQTVAELGALPTISTDAPPGALLDALTALVRTIPASPIMADLDVGTGHLEVDVRSASVTWHVHDLFGRPRTIVYRQPSAPPISGVTTISIVPLAVVRAIAEKLVTK